MREQLIQYVNLLFAGAPDSDDMRQEILQNTLDRYDDLVRQGKTPEAAYRLAISGIGNINEILGKNPVKPTVYNHYTYEEPPKAEQTDTPEQKRNRAAAIAMYILCPVPLFILSDLGIPTLGLCMTLLLVAAATMLLIMNKNPQEDSGKTTPIRAENNVKRSIGKLISVVGLVLYFIISFSTGAWYITWLIFPIISCVKGLINAIMDLKEENSYEI